MTISLNFFSPKAGLGCSTTAALTALAYDSERTLIVDASPEHDLDAVLGIQPATDDATLVAENLWYTPIELIGQHASVDPRNYDVVVWDRGTNFEGMDAGTKIMVVRPCYVALRRAVGHAPRADHVVAIEEPKRALLTADIEVALGAPTIGVDYSTDVMRAVDAGLVTSRRFKLGNHVKRQITATVVS